MAIIRVSGAGYRACQDPEADHKLKVYMKRNDGQQVNTGPGDSWAWSIEGDVTAVREDVKEMFGHLKDISVDFF